METILSVRDLKIHYKTMKGFAKAVDNVSFDVHDVEILGIAGESGCGKSTLGNSLVIVKKPMNYISGMALYDGQNVFTTPLSELNKIRYEKISIIPQYAMDAMSPTKKIHVLIKDLLKEHGIGFTGEIRKKILERFALVNLEEDVLSKFPIELSGGMKQRVIMVISTLLDPELLIADEITSALDVTSQRYVANMIANFRNKKIVKSVIFITHDLSILYEISDRIMVMYAGHIVEIAPTDTIIKSPRHPYTMALVKSLPRPGVRFMEKKLCGIPGYPPSLIEIGEGCRFRDRCPYKTERCIRETPVTEKCAPDHSLACWNWRTISEEVCG
jgi:peptide/nickel transport system ATP-binding protein